MKGSNNNKMYYYIKFYIVLLDLFSMFKTSNEKIARVSKAIDILNQ